MKNRSIRNIENEIVHQVLIAEICLDICVYISKIEKSKLCGRGNDFLPFYYNLNFSKGINTLHTLLLSSSNEELSVRNFLKKYKKVYPRESTADFEKKVEATRKQFEKAFPISLRNKVTAHADEKFKHIDFTSGYILLEKAEQYSQVVNDLRSIIFGFTGHAQKDYPYDKILRKSKTFIESILVDSNEMKHL